MGYVVTFEQTDPLYTVDLSDPENPVTTGELKIPGYSAYLHPVADGRLLGIGQAGTDERHHHGRPGLAVRRRRPEQPERLDALGPLGRSLRLDLDRVGPPRLPLTPPSTPWPSCPSRATGAAASRGAIAMAVDPDGGLAEIAHLEDEGQIERIARRGREPVTVSAKGVKVRELSEL